MAKYLFFDTETTGNQSKDRIIQVGGILIDCKKQFGLFDELCNISEILNDDKGESKPFDELCSTDTPISIEAMAVHHITPEMIEGKPPFSKSKFYEILNRYNTSDNFLIAHNIKFDLSMLQKEGFKNQYTLIDTLRCAKHLLPDENSHALQYLRYSLGLYKLEDSEAKKHKITIKAHDAIGDVLIMKLLFAHLVETIKAENDTINPTEKLVELTNTPVLIKNFKFGKYKNRQIEDIAQEERGYLEWMLKSLELDEDMRYTLKYYLSKY